MSINYAQLTGPQRAQWHAEVYALRRVTLGVPHDFHTSPCDPQGRWYDDRLVSEAEVTLRAKLAEQSLRCRADTAARNAIRFRDGAAGYAEAAE